jgi:hypothetical protein
MEVDMVSSLHLTSRFSGRVKTYRMAALGLSPPLILSVSQIAGLTKGVPRLTIDFELVDKGSCRKSAAAGKR